MSQLPLWAQWMDLIVRAAGTVGLGAFVAWIAYRQWQTAHQRAVLDLFERRMAVYDAARDVISDILREGTATAANIVQYTRATDRLGMLFGDEVVSYSKKTRERIVKLSYHESMVKAGLAGQKVQGYANHVDKSAALTLELSEFYTEFSALVLPYVRMTQKVPL